MTIRMLCWIIVLAVASHWSGKSTSKLSVAAPTPFISSSIPVSPNLLTPQKIFSKAIPGMVRIVAADAAGNAMMSGTGFIISNDGIVATNYHVIYKGERIIATLHDGREQEIKRFIAADPISDIILLQLEPGSYHSLDLASGLPDVGSKVYAIGNPLGLENTLSDGIVSGIRRKGIRNSLIQVTASISPGSSGGPVIGEDGKVIGVATAFMRGGQNLNLVTPVAVINRLRESAPDLPQSLECLPQSWFRRAEAIVVEIGYPKKSTKGLFSFKRNFVEDASKDIAKLRAQLGDTEGAFSLLTALSLEATEDNYVYMDISYLLAETGDVNETLQWITAADLYKSQRVSIINQIFRNRNADRESSLKVMQLSDENSYNRIVLKSVCIGDRAVVDMLAGRIKSTEGCKSLAENRLIGEIVKSSIDSTRFSKFYNAVNQSNSNTWFQVGRIERNWGNNTLAAIAFSNARKCEQTDVLSGKVDGTFFRFLLARIAKATGDIATYNKEISDSVTALIAKEPIEMTRFALLAMYSAQIGDRVGAQTYLAKYEWLSSTTDMEPANMRCIAYTQAKIGDRAGYERTATRLERMKFPLDAFWLGRCGDTHRFQTIMDLLPAKENDEWIYFRWRPDRDLEGFVSGLCEDKRWNEAKLFIPTLHSPADQAIAYLKVAQAVTDAMTKLEGE